LQRKAKNAVKFADIIYFSYKYNFVVLCVYDQLLMGCINILYEFKMHSFAGNISKILGE